MKLFIFSVCFFSLSSLFAIEPLRLPLRGQGQYKWFLLEIYEAKLWGEKIDDIYSRPLQLELKYKRNFKGKDIAEQSVKELIGAGHSKSEADQWKKKLLEIFPDVKEGDAISASYTPGEGIVFHLNSAVELGRLVDPSLSKKFLDIWLGESTSSPELRRKLLGSNIKE